MGNLSVIGKVHIKDIKALKEWHASGDFKKWHKVNWSPELAAYHHIKWEDTDQIAFYQMQDKIPGLSKSLDRTGSWMSDLLEMAGYLQSIGLSLNLLYLDDQHRFAVISGADTEKAYTLPCQFLDIEEYKDYSDYTPDQMCSIAGETASSIIPSGQGFSSVTDVKKDIYSKEEKLKEQENALKKLQQEQEEKLEEMKRQLMEQYRPLWEMIEKKQAELEEEKKKLENQLTVLDTQIYAIRCITGEVVDFTQLVTGRHADTDSSVVIYQKLRYIDEELGKYLALYDVDGDDAGLFEDILKNREDLRDLFSPGEKAVSFVKVSRSGIGYKNHEKFANMLQKYEKYHGHTIGILIKDGENLYMGWTDEDRIDIHDENIFFAPQEETVSQETEETSCYIRKEYKQLQGPPTFSTHMEVLKNDMGLCYGKVTEENAMEYAKWKVKYYGKDGFYCEYKSFSPEKKAYRREVYSAEHAGTERHYFISEVKEDSGYDWRTDSHKKKARANMEVYNGEFLNLTYLDSVRLRYAIANRKVTSWRIGRCDVDYAAALRYLNKALEYLDEREKKEKEMLLKYMDKLPENWQVDLTLWRKEHGYHALTGARAKKWALERK